MFPITTTKSAYHRYSLRKMDMKQICSPGHQNSKDLIYTFSTVQCLHQSLSMVNVLTGMPHDNLMVQAFPVQALIKHVS
jgi:hypothetical protein